MQLSDHLHTEEGTPSGLVQPEGSQVGLRGSQQACSWVKLQGSFLWLCFFITDQIGTGTGFCWLGCGGLLPALHPTTCLGDVACSEQGPAG